MGAVDLRNGVWLNEPAIRTIEATRLAVTTDARTDFWRDTYYGFRRDSGHFLGFEAKGDFMAEIRVRAAFRQLYDQAGLMVRIDEAQWLKAGVEYADGRAMPGTVVTLGTSDWSLGAPAFEPRDFRLRLVAEKGAMQVRLSSDGRSWALLRLAPFPAADRYLVGPMCCTPERAGLDVTFSDFTLGPAPGKDLHDLT